MKLVQELKDMFNWKKYPANVFYLAIPLFLVASLFMLLAAILHIKLNGDIGYLIIWLAGMVLLGIGLVPAWRIYKATQKLPQPRQNPPA